MTTQGAEPMGARAPSLLEVAERVGKPIRIATDEAICKEGDASDRCWVIRAGRADVIVNDEVVGSATVGEAIGELGLLEDRPRGATVMAATPVELLEIDGGCFRGMLASSPDLALSLLSTAAVRLGRSNSSVAESAEAASEPTPATAVHPRDRARVEIAVLGPLVVRVDGSPIDIGAPKERAVLTMLAVDPGARVGGAALVDALWGDAPPATAERSLQSHVSRLRGRLPDGLIVGDGVTGYELDVGDGAVDAWRFIDLVASAAASPDRAVEVLERALGLWRGECLVDLADGARRAGASARLGEIRCHADEELAAARIACGAVERAVADLEAMVAAEPSRERRWVLLVDGLRMSGRTADALRAFGRARTILVDQFGVEPGDALRAAEARALAG